MDEEEHAPLIGSYQESSGDKSLSNSSVCRIRKPKRKIVVEPVLVILAVSGFALQMTVSLYTYRRFQEEAAEEMGINISTIDFSKLMDHCSLNKSSEVYILSHLAQKKNSYFNIVTGIANAIPNLVTATFLGPYSDKAGRKYAIVIPLVGTLIYSAVCLVVTKFTLPVWYLIIGNFIDGLGGRYIVLLIGCFSYIADITPKDDRQFRITIVELIMFLSAVVGPVGVGYWIQKADYFWPITASAAAFALNVLYSLLCIPETIIKDPEAKFFTITHLKTIVKVYTDDDTPGRRWKLKLLYLAFIPVILPTLGDNVSTLFKQNPPLCWQSVKIGNYTAISTAIAILGGIIFAKLAKYFMRNHTIALISAFSSVVRNIYNALVMNDWMMYVCKYHCTIILL